MNKTILLASNSPRRKDILTQLHLPFTICPSSFKEIQPDHMAAHCVPEYFARGKVSALAETLGETTEEHFILGADTAIIFNDTCIGKPANREQAKTYLQLLSGNTHQVITGIAVLDRNNNQMISQSVTSTVTIKPLTAEEIDWYLNTGEWQGVAGAYRIQESFSRFVSSISGSYSGIIGLPISELYDILNQLHYPVLDSMQ